jgi:hypothetical protein
VSRGPVACSEQGWSSDIQLWTWLKPLLGRCVGVYIEVFVMRIACRASGRHADGL